MADAPIPKAPGAWDCKCQVYLIAWYSKTKELPSNAYSPLEAASTFASAENGQPVGGLHTIQILRYLESPVGQYDEILITPGAFVYPIEVDGKRKEKKNMRITRIYVSSKASAYNGRLNWNIPKHLARFEWEDLPNGATRVKVFPHDTVGDGGESQPSSVPFFQTTFKTVPLVPGFPMTTGLYKTLGIDVTLAGPPLPQGSSPELVGTNSWANSFPSMFTWKCHAGWFDMKQVDDKGKQVGEHENFWPGMKTWVLGCRMDNVDFHFREGQYWDSPKTTR